MLSNFKMSINNKPSANRQEASASRQMAAVRHLDSLSSSSWLWFGRIQPEVPGHPAP